MATPKVTTAPLAIIKVNGVAIGRMKNIRVTESIQRGRVSGIGELLPQELPATGWNGTLSCGFFLIDLKQATNGAIPWFDGVHSPTIADIQAWVDGVLLQEEGVTIDLYKKVSTGIADPATGLLQRGQDEILGSVIGAFVTRNGFDITENSISGRDCDFEYMNPILFTPGS